jgi:hypothetical protein
VVSHSNTPGAFLRATNANHGSLYGAVVRSGHHRSNRTRHGGSGAATTQTNTGRKTSQHARHLISWSGQISGHGEFFDVAMYDSMLTLLKSNVAAYNLTGKQSKLGEKALVPFGLFPTVDGRIVIAAPVERHWQALCHAMAREDLISDDRTRSNRRRAAYQDFIEAQISAWTSVKSKEDILASIGGNVPCFPANTMA